MKKFKLIANLSAVLALSSGTAITVASCSCYNNDDFTIKFESYEVPLNGDDTLYFTVSDKNGKQINIKRIESVISSDVKVVEILETLVFEGKTGVIRARGFNKERSVIFKIKFVDENDRTIEKEVSILVVPMTDEKLVITTSEIPQIVYAGDEEEFDVFATYDGNPIEIATCEVVSSDGSVLTASYSNGKVTIYPKETGTVTLTLYVTDVDGHYNKLVTHTIEVRQIPLDIEADVPNIVYVKDEETFAVLAKYDGEYKEIASCEVLSSNNDRLTGSYDNGEITLSPTSIGSVTLTLKVTDVEGHYGETTYNIDVQKIDLEVSTDPVIPQIVYTGSDKEYEVLATYKGDPATIDDCVVTVNITEGGTGVLTAEYTNGKLIIHPANVGKVIITLEVTDDKGHDGKLITQEIDVQQTENNITYDNITYRLKDNIDPNDFCGTMEEKTFEKADGETITIDDVTKLTSIKIVSCDPTKTTIGDDFIIDCTALTNLELTGLEYVDTIGANFVKGCTVLQSFDLTPLANVQTIGNYFVNGCTALETIDLSG